MLPLPSVLVFSLFHCYGAPRDLHSFPTRPLPISNVARPDGNRRDPGDRRNDVTRNRNDGAPPAVQGPARRDDNGPDRKSTRLNSSHLGISYAVFCLKKKTKIRDTANIRRRTCERI